MEGLVFLDFDGVICDSLLETLVSSWQGYYRMRGEEEPPLVPAALLQEFTALRPYVRAGEDFILIHELIAAGTTIRTQKDFDTQLAQRGKRRIARYKECFYRARGDLLARERTYWISLNKLYPHVVPSLRGWASHPAFYILSTKRASFIVEILTAKGISVEPERVLSCEAKEKKNTILATLEARGAGRALFIDDQIDHLAPESSRDPRIVGCLATWGYVQQQWLRDPLGVELLYPNRLAGCVQPWLED
jgi:phosphoglycolate phosphatase-like HAD superfamily hydrolase